LGYILTALAMLCTSILAASALRRARKAWPILRLLEGKRWMLILVVCLVWILGIGAFAWKEGLDRQSWLALDQGPNGELVQKATRRCLQEELKRDRAEAASQARAHFDAGELGHAAMRYPEAAEYYERSVQAHPTASGFLNLGISLLYLGEFPRAEAALSSGIQIARRGDAGRIMGAYLDGRGRAALGQGRLEAALGFHRAALQIHTETGNPLGRANAHANIGNVYLAQGRLDEALISHREAFALYTRMRNHLGRANALNHLGVVYGRLGQQDEALRVFQEALSLDTDIGNLLGQARDLSAIAGILAAQGKRQAALERLRGSQELLQQLGLGKPLDTARMTGRAQPAPAVTR
ncbi:MAG TPA: tetratricopeptide repeat protein, partial [Candidatus Acidoferrum sp.]|nr:tetratricopeptide repeat protein [Candidatus Acidoferrum sp.]